MIAGWSILWAALAGGIGAFIGLGKRKPGRGLMLPLLAMVAVIAVASGAFARLLVLPTEPVRIMPLSGGALRLTGAGSGPVEVGGLEADCGSGWSLSVWNPTAEWHGDEAGEALLLQVPAGTGRWLRFEMLENSADVEAEAEGRTVRLSTAGEGRRELMLMLPDSSAESLKTLGSRWLAVYALLTALGCLLMGLGIRRVRSSSVQQASGRSGLADLLRLVFCVVVIVYHSTTTLAHKGYLGVEYFFLLGGWLLMAHYEKRRDHADLREYALSRVSRLLPFYLYRYLLGLVCLVMTADAGLLQLISRSLGDLLMLQCAGITAQAGVMDGTAWYMSAFVLASLAVYSLLCTGRERYLHLIAPLAAVVIVGYCLAVNGNLDLTTETAPGMLMTMGFWRGFAELGLGCLLFVLTGRRKQQASPAAKAWQTVLETALLGAILWILLSWRKKESDLLPLLLMMALVASVMSGGSYLSRVIPARAAAWLGALSLPMYLLHKLVWVWIHDALPQASPELTAAAVVAASAALSAVSMPLVNAASRLPGRLKGGMRS